MIGKGSRPARTAAQQAASVLNGKKGGRPKPGAGGIADERRVRAKAREMCIDAQLAAIEFLQAVFEGKVPGVSVDNRIRAAENLLDRGGLPRRTEQELVGEQIPIKLVDLTGWDAPADTGLGERPETNQ